MAPRTLSSAACLSLGNRWAGPAAGCSSLGAVSEAKRSCPPWNKLDFTFFSNTLQFIFVCSHFQ